MSRVSSSMVSHRVPPAEATRAPQRCGTSNRVERAIGKRAERSSVMGHLACRMWMTILSASPQHQWRFRMPPMQPANAKKPAGKAPPVAALPRSQQLRLDLLQTFEAAARHLSFTQAGAELALSQPAISRQMQQL